MRPAPLFAVIALLLSSQWALAHEFWIEPEKYQVQKGADLRAELINGQEFEGISMSFLPNNITRFDLARGADVAPVEGRMGDRPALQTTAPDRDGLLVILHEAAPSSIRYDEWAKFMAFAEHKDFPTMAQDHAAAGWPQTGFYERYSRHSKALVAIGDGEGADQNYGLETEFVALTNSYAANFNNKMKVQLFYGGKPRGDAQVEVFDRDAAGEVTITLHRTDETGHATIPVSAGHIYLFDAVVLRPAADAGSTDKAPVWETLWAALTFAVPG